MKRLLFVLFLVGVGVGVLGFYRGWFTFGSDRGEGKTNVTLSVDTDKIQQDRKAAVSGVKNLGSKSENQAADKSTD